MVVTTHSEDLEKLRMQVKRQGDVVRKLKEESASESDIKRAVAELKSIKKMLEMKELQMLPKDPQFDRGKLEDLLKQKFFYDQAFSIYGGIQGLYDYGPMGCAMKANLLQAWRQFFILNDHLLEVDCSMLTPEPVLQASGHVDRFTDWMVKDVETGECFRADHLIKGALEALGRQKKTSEAQKHEIENVLTQLDNYTGDELNAIIRQYNLKSPNTQNDLTEPQKFNLMFSTMIGPTGQCKGYLRPETAQGIFVNFQRLLQFNQGRLPFGAAQIGSAFRNEISPRSGLIRVREFCMAEIEYFVDPTNKNHPKFDQVKSVEMCLYSSCDQMDGNKPRRLTIGDAVKQGLVANETLGYFMARIQLFLVHIGVDLDRLRFRQHLSNEMAHYACDCWDAECLTSYGWIECVGCADRSCYDLTQHTKATGSRLVAEKPLSEPRTVQICDCIPNKGALGKTFKADAKSITERLASLDLDEARMFKKQMESTGKIALDVGGKSFTLESSMIQFKEHEDVVHVEEIVPNVIEPSFGIGRILYTVFEHSFRVREEDEQRTYLSVPPVLAPYKCSILPLSNHPDFAPIIKNLSSALTQCNVSHRIDESSGSIGRRYARTDQIAIPFGITIDFDTINKNPPTATLRERDSMAQIRVPLDQLPTLVSGLSTNLMSWDQARAIYPTFEQQETVQESQNEKSQRPSKNEIQPKNKPTIKNNHKDNQAHDNQSTKMKTIDQDVWSSATEDFPELTKPNQNLDSESKPAQLKPKYKEECKTNIPAQNTDPNSQSLSWSSWGKAIRKRYQEEEEREKKMQKQNQKPTVTTADREELKSINSGYEADQEDNVGHKLGSISTESSILPDGSSPAGETNVQPDQSKITASVQKETVYHGLFVGDGWPGSKPKSQPKMMNSVITKTTRNMSTQPKHETILPKPDRSHAYMKECTVTTASFDFAHDSLDSEMRQLLESNAHMERFPLSSNAKVVAVDKDRYSSVPDMTPNSQTTVELSKTRFHGLFTGPGWPVVKKEENSKASTKSVNCKQTDVSKIILSSDPKPSIPSKTPAKYESDKECPNNWSSTVSRMNDTLLDSEQWQLQWAEPIGELNFGSLANQPLSHQTSNTDKQTVPSFEPAECQIKTSTDIKENRQLTPTKPPRISEQSSPNPSVADLNTQLAPVQSSEPVLLASKDIEMTLSTPADIQPPKKLEQSSHILNAPQEPIIAIQPTSPLTPDTSAEATAGSPNPEPSTETLKKKNKKRKPKKKTH